ncbi:MAG: ABC transporter permease [Actinomycetota bacterium]|nr:ABC transporter permease [Actinomycetota bacterium]
MSTSSPSVTAPASVSFMAVCRARAVAEIKAFLRQKESVVFTLLFPVMMLILFGFIFGHNAIGGSVNFSTYFVAGMIGAGVLASSFQNLAIQIPIERDDGLLKRLRGTPMPKAAYFVGKIVMVLFVMVLEVILLAIVGALFFGLRLPADASRWGVFVALLLLGTAAMTLLGIGFSSVPKNGSSAPAMVTPVALVLQFISGVYFVFTDLPGWLQSVAAIFPLKWLTQGLRYVFLPDGARINEAAGSWELGKVFLILVVWAVAGLALCITTFRWRNKSDG